MFAVFSVVLINFDKGISCLLLGQLTPAEEHFQLAGRWAEEPTDKLVSLSNIASLQCAVAYFQAPIYDGSSDTFPSKDQVCIFMSYY